MWHRFCLWGGAGFLLLLVSIVCSLSLGSAKLSFIEVWRVLFHYVPILGDMITPDWPASSEQIILKVRFPRIILAVLVGAALSLAGASFQGVLRNPLADPYTLGVASGSAVGAALLILLGFQFSLIGIWSIPLIAFATGLISLWFVLALANTNGKFQLQTLILSGVVVQAFLGAVVSFMVSMSNNVVNEIVFWMMGGLSLRGWQYSILLLPILAVGMCILLAHARALNLFALGERQAAHMGVNVERTKLIVLAVSTLITAGAVSVAGIIGFVGLVIPHMLRIVAGADYRLILPLSPIYGGVYVLWADTLARTILSPTEIPLGIVTAFVGAPFFAYLLRRNKRNILGAGV